MTGDTRIRIEVEVVEGLEAVAAQEINDVVGKRSSMQQLRAGIRFDYNGDLKQLFRLKTVTAVYIVNTFQIPRPKALLGHQNFHQMLDTISLVRQLHEKGAFRTLHISAAGSNSSVMQRIKSELAEQSALSVDDDNGDLFLRIIRAQGAWEVLTRTTPRPLSTRSWRVCNYEGALNASVAHAMIRLVELQPEDRVLNLMCGSASLLIEAAAFSRSSDTLFGCDLAAEALQCGARNIGQAQQNTRVELFQADVVSIPVRSDYATVMLADLPFGNLVGSHNQNLILYPKVLEEAYRVAHPGCRFAVITHEKQLMEQLLKSSNWICEREMMITLRGLHPRIYLLRKAMDN